MTKSEKALQDLQVEEAWDLWHEVQSELEFLQDAQGRLKNLLDDHGVHEWGRQNWSEDSERVLSDLHETLRDLGKLAK